MNRGDGREKDGGLVEGKKEMDKTEGKGGGKGIVSAWRCEGTK